VQKFSNCVHLIQLHSIILSNFYQTEIFIKNDIE
jgi:hypothetical protein